MNKQDIGKIKNNEENGITLVTLVITIILMLILLGVTVKLTTDGNLIDSANNTVNTTQNYIEEQQGIVDQIRSEMENLVLPDEIINPDL